MWFIDNPWPPLILFVCGAVVMFAVWTSTKRNYILVGSFLLLALGGGTFLLDQLVETEEERVEALVYEMADNFRQLDVEGTLAFFSPQAEQYRKYVRRGGEMILEIPKLRITDVEVELLAGETRARSHFRANGLFSIKGMTEHRFSSRWELTWQLEAGEWKIIDLKRLDPINGREISPFSAS